MGSSGTELLQRRFLPGLVVRLSRVTWPARLGAAARRRLHRRGRVELFFAFDDPCSAIALTDLAERLSGREVLLLLRPVVHRGIPGDPAVDQKRRYAIDDARRIARRLGMVLQREEPLAAEQTAFLAEWVAGAPQGPALQRFCVAAVARLWLTGEGSLARPDYEALWRDCLGTEPGAGEGDPAVRRNERLMKRRRPYDVPAAWVHGQWFFAHDRLPQIAERLDELGWRAR
jgi:2-hydroxychromene-2-carboxylate isomerase